MKKNYFLFSLQIAILPTSFIILNIISSDLNDKYDHSVAGDIAILVWLVTAIISFISSIFVMFKIKKWKLKIVYFLLNILLFVFFSHYILLHLMLF